MPVPTVLIVYNSFKKFDNNILFLLGYIFIIVKINILEIRTKQIISQIFGKKIIKFLILIYIQ